MKYIAKKVGYLPMKIDEVEGYFTPVRVHTSSVPKQFTIYELGFDRVTNKIGYRIQSDNEFISITGYTGYNERITIEQHYDDTEFFGTFLTLGRFFPSVGEIENYKWKDGNKSTHTTFRQMLKESKIDDFNMNLRNDGLPYRCTDVDWYECVVIDPEKKFEDTEGFISYSAHVDLAGVSDGNHLIEIYGTLSNAFIGNLIVRKNQVSPEFEEKIKAGRVLHKIMNDHRPVPYYYINQLGFLGSCTIPYLWQFERKKEELSNLELYQDDMESETEGML